MPAHVEAVGRVVRTGRREPKLDERTLQAADYLTLPKPRSRVYRSKYVGPSWGMMGNDSYGDCTCAAGGHAIQLTTGAVSKGSHVVAPSDEEILAAYWATGSPPLPNADDNGRSELDVLNYWRSHGIGGHRLHAYAALKTGGPTKAMQDELRLAIQLFGLAYLGIGLPISAQRQKVWKVVTGADAKPWSWGGHAVVVVDYDSHGLTCVTWGALVKMTWGFAHRYVDEAYACVLPEWLDAAGHSIDGFDLGQLDADLAAIPSR